jgi:hypothetical protein
VSVQRVCPVCGVEFVAPRRVHWKKFCSVECSYTDRRGRVADWPAPPPTIQRNHKPRLNPAFVEWMMGLPQGWVTSVPGVSNAAALKMLGNGVVPQQAALALQLIGGTHECG